MHISKPDARHPASEEMFSITDLIDLEKLQQIQDAFAEANEVASTLTDAQGIPLTRPSNHSKVCALIRATQKGLDNCINSGKQFGLQAHLSQKSLHHPCGSVGFTDAAAPIIVNGKHIANWLIGQGHVGNVDVTRIKEYALEIGANPEKMIQAFEEMPKMSIQKFEKKLALLELMARELSLMSYQRLIQLQQNAELNLTKEQLEKHQFQLEALVEERTAVLQQVNEQLTAEISQKSKMQKRQNRLITAIESAAEAIIITSPAGKIIFVNPAFEQLTGYSAQEAIHKTPRILQSGHHDNKFYNDLWQTILAGKVWKGRFTNKRKNGTFYQEEGTISPVKNDDGTVVNFVAVKKDITKEIELETQLQQAQKLESLGTLAAGMAHEINTPVQYVLSNTNFLREVFNSFLQIQDSYQNLVQIVSASGSYSEQVDEMTRLAKELDLNYLKDESEKAFEDTIEGINKISAIIGSMKEFSQPESGEKRLEDLNRIIRTTVDVTSNQWQDVAEIDLDLEAELPPAPLIVAHLKQVLLEMILNAIYALNAKHTSLPQQKGRISITTRTVGDKIDLYIADTGIGISRADIGKVFDPFFTTKPVGKGSGQGLSVVRGIVDKHNGTIAVSSTQGQGTEFTISLPLCL
ncbi:MAG: PocR ligand-binding domain-containing protein [Desulforhopalus sp.]